MKLRESAEAALEAMDKATRFMSDSDYRKLNEAITALRAALAETNQDEIHSCSYYCTNFACIKAQRDELRDRLENMKGNPNEDVQGVAI